MLIILPAMKVFRLFKSSKFIVSKVIDARVSSNFMKNFSQTSATSSILPHKLLSEEGNPGIDHYQQSLTCPDYFQVADLFTVEDLFNANVHLGHREGSLNNYMRPYLFGSRLGHLVFDLNHTAALLRDALNFTAHISLRGGVVLFVCRGAQHQILVEKTAEECREFAHTREWSDKTFTEPKRVFGCETRLPDLVIFLNTMNIGMEQHIAVRDSAKLLIPTIGIVDSNCDPRLIVYPVPGNDDTHGAMKLYCKLFKQAIIRGKQKRKEINNE